MANADDDTYDLVPSEYDVAAQRFISTGVKALMQAQGGIYSLVSKESMEKLPDYSLPLSDDEDLRGHPIEASSVTIVNYDEVIEGDYDSVLAAMDSMAIEMTGQITKGILAHISEVCERTGNVVTDDLSWEVIADIFERTDYSFDEYGNHNLSIVTNPEGAERIRALGEPTAEQRAHIDEIISRKRDEWNARRSSRSLPSRRD